jgi:hypothetical protein
MVLPDEEARADRGRRFDALLMNHWFFLVWAPRLAVPVAGSEPSSPS